ncbi:PPIase cyclophilin-type domain-containing protein [Aphelenchoides besseyi]|nr:PPIase cyclophilin-type domain-containing protein [Aphelenchoides besseyi]
MSNQYIHEPSTNGKVCLQTTMGDVDIELWSKETPIACRNFVQLCMEGYYNQCTFHTIIKDCIVQTGDPSGTGEGGKSIFEKDFKIESHQRLRFNRRGLVAMAANPDGFNGSQFFITLGATHELNGKHTLFGKITGNTIFNFLGINEAEVDSENKPIRSEKITGVRIISNPFDDIVPRRLPDEKPKKKSKKDRDAQQKDKKPTNKNTGLLSFGDEMEEEEEIINNVSKTFKGKSAHDVLDDEKLSKTLAVQPEKLGIYANDDEETEGTSQLSKVKERLKGKKSKKQRDHSDNEDDENYADAFDDQRKKEKLAEKERLAAEVKALQKEYIKAVRGPKQRADPNDDSLLTSGMKQYKNAKLKFKSKTKGVVSQQDPQRESQSMHFLQRFQTTMKRGTVQDILTNKNVDISDLPSREELIREGAIPKKRKLPADMMPDYEEEEEGMETEEIDDSNQKAIFDEEATDDVGETWMGNTFVAPEDTSGVTKALDANLREESEDWYDISDPRNKMNRRKREEI